VECDRDSFAYLFAGDEKVASMLNVRLTSLVSGKLPEDGYGGVGFQGG